MHALRLAGDLAANSNAAEESLSFIKEVHSFGLDFGTALTITDVLDLAIVGVLLAVDVYRKKSYKPFLTVFIVFLIGSLLWQLRYTNFWQTFAKNYADLFYK